MHREASLLLNPAVKQSRIPALCTHRISETVSCGHLFSCSTVPAGSSVFDAEFWHVGRQKAVTTLVRRDGITNYHLIAYSFSNISAKNYQNRLMCIEVIA